MPFLSPPLFFSPNQLHKSCLCNDNSATLPAGEQKDRVGRERGRALKWAFLTRTWQMSSHGVWALAGSEFRRRVGVTKTERKKKNNTFLLFSALGAFKRGFFSFCFLFLSFLQAGVSLVWPAESQRLCKNSPSAVVIDAAALWRQLGQAGSLQPRLPLPLSSVSHASPRVVESARVPFGCVLLFFLLGEN